MKPRKSGTYRVIGYGNRHNRKGTLIGDFAAEETASEAADAWMKLRHAQHEDDDFTTTTLPPEGKLKVK